MICRDAFAELLAENAALRADLAEAATEQRRQREQVLAVVATHGAAARAIADAAIGAARRPTSEWQRATAEVAAAMSILRQLQAQS